MKRFLPFLSPFFLLSFLQAGYFIQQRSYTYRDGQKKESITKIWLEGANIRLETQKQITIVNYKNKTVYFVNKSRKTYYKMTLEQLRQLLNAMVELMKQMGGDVSAKIEVTGEKRTIRGYNCSVVLMKMGTFQTIEQCLSPQVKIKMTDYIRVLEVMLPQEMVKELRSREKVLEELGFPVYSKSTISYMGKSRVSETYLESYQQLVIPPKVFTVPQGYERKAFTSPYSRR